MFRLGVRSFSRLHLYLHFCLIHLSFTINIIAGHANNIALELDSEADILFQEMIEGEVESENYTYYIVNSNEDIIVNLTSLIGDCDLYVSQTRKVDESPPNPTIETNSYDLLSTTCGEDVITINKAIQRPFCIGIYAHPSHNICSYHLEIKGIKSEQSDFYIHQEIENYESNYESNGDYKKIRKSTSSWDGNFESFLDIMLSIFIHFLEMVFEILI